LWACIVGARTRTLARHAWLATIVVLCTAFLAKPLLAAEIECSSDAGIPSGGFAPLDVGNLRKSLADTGFSTGGLYVGEAFTNTGGIRQEATYDGALWTYVLGDLQKAGLWKGLCFYADAYQIHGRSITADNVGSLVTVSTYEALPSTRLSELWFEQHLFDDHVTARIGQLTADTEFLLSLGGSNFLNSTWGWATLPSFDLPGSGPSYPLAASGVRVAVIPNDKWKLMLGVYNGDPAGSHCTNNPEACNDNGLDFRLDSPPLLIVEGGYKYNQDGQLPGSVKVGGWNQFGTLHEQPSGLAVPTIAVPSDSVPIQSDWAIYSVVDQLVWRAAGSTTPKGVGLFARVMGAPDQQTLVNFYADGGVTFSGVIPHRTDDTLAIGLTYTGISDDEHIHKGQSGRPIAFRYEALFEMCYTAKLSVGWTLQPDFQYIWHPGDPTSPNAAIWGLRSILSF
jgi:porin